jgi:hypothetical protein
MPTRWSTVLLQKLERERPSTAARLSRLLYDRYLTTGAAADVLLRQAQRTDDRQFVVRTVQDHLADLIIDHTDLVRSTLLSLPTDLIADRPWLRVGREFVIEGLTPSSALNRRGIRRITPAMLSTPEAAIRTMISKRLRGKVHRAVQAAAIVRVAAERPAADGTWPAHDNLDIVFIQTGVTVLLDGDLPRPCAISNEPSRPGGDIQDSRSTMRWESWPSSTPCRATSASRNDCSNRPPTTHCPAPPSATAS